MGPTKLPTGGQALPRTDPLPGGRPLYKILDVGGKPRNGGKGAWPLPIGGPEGEWTPGEWTAYITPLVMCGEGYHLARSNSVAYWSHMAVSARSPLVFLAEGRGEWTGGMGTLGATHWKICCSQARLLRPVVGPREWLEMILRSLERWVTFWETPRKANAQLSLVDLTLITRVLDAGRSAVALLPTMPEALTTPPTHAMAKPLTALRPETERVSVLMSNGRYIAPRRERCALRQVSAALHDLCRNPTPYAAYNAARIDLRYAAESLSLREVRAHDSALLRVMDDTLTGPAVLSSLPTVKPR